MGGQRPQGQSLVCLEPGRQGGPGRYLGDNEPGLPSRVCLVSPFLFCLQNKETQPLQGSVSDSSNSSCLPLLLAVAAIHVSSSSVSPVLLWASGPLTECTKGLRCPVHLLEALDCAPFFPVFLASPQTLSLPDGQLLTILPIPAISRGLSGC